MFNRTLSSYDELKPGNAAQKDYQDSCKMLAAAVINKHFRKQLLDNPEKALETGFGGQSFQIGLEMKEKIGTIRANDLSEFAFQFTQQMEPSAMMVSSYAGD